MKPTVLLLESIAPAADRLLRKATRVLDAPAPDRGLELLEGEAVSAIITRGKGDVSARLIDACTDLRVIARCGVGLNNIDLAHATQKGVAVTNTPGANAATVAEHTMGLMLALRRRLWPAISEVKEGRWSYRNSYGGDEVRGARLGILGAGNIGTRVGTLAEAFGMKVTYWVRSERPANSTLNTNFELEEILSKSDIVSLHLPLTSQTRHLIGERELATMPAGSQLINTARAEIIDHAALRSSLKSGHLGGYAADVPMDPLPAKADALTALSNVLLTPHMASLTAATYGDMCQLAVENALRILSGEEVDKHYIYHQSL